MLHLALKLLVLVHTSGDITLDNTNPTVQNVMNEYARSISNLPATPCFIRSQFGEVMPLLAQDLLNQLIHRLERCSLQQNCSHWEIIFSSFAVLLMMAESGQYHAARKPYHKVYDLPECQTPPKEGERLKIYPSDSVGEALINFYGACFPKCHRRLNVNGTYNLISSRLLNGQIDTSSRFITNLQVIITEAKLYIQERSRITLTSVSGDMSNFFDRQLSRLFLVDK